MLNIKLQIPDSLKKKLDPVRFQKAIQDGAVMTAKELQAIMRPYPGPVKHPIEWINDKQRRGYFAMRREQGLPAGYTRQSDPMSERLMESSVVEPVRGGARLAYSASYADKVIGDKQQPFHKNTGWKNLFDEAEKFFKSGRAQKVFSTVLRKFLGG